MKKQIQLIAGGVYTIHSIFEGQIKACYKAPSDTRLLHSDYYFTFVSQKTGDELTIHKSKIIY